MTWQEIRKALNHVSQSIFDSIFGDFKYAKQAAIALLAVGLLVAGYYGYRWYHINQEQAAQQLFSHNIEEFDRVLEEGKKEDWINVESLFKLGYEQYSNSVLAPFFLLYQAQAMLKQDKKEQAYQVLDKAVSQMKASSPLTDVYKASMALMRIDSQDKEIQNAGITQLQAIAQDQTSTAFDIASYYLGLYYMSIGQAAQSKEIWQKLIESQKEVTQLGKSPWARLAQQKLGQEIE